MLIPITWWQQVRERFSEGEAAELNRACTGETAWPQGMLIDEKKIPPELREKLEGLRDGAEKTRAGQRVLTASAGGHEDG